MPAEILNRLATSLPAMEKESTKLGSSKEVLSPATEMKRFKFAMALPVVNIDILPPESRDCPQCQKPYNFDFEIAGKRNGHEAAALLPCNCVIGFHCARKWLSPYELGFTCCPLCEEEFPDMSEDTNPLSQSPPQSHWARDTGKDSTATQVDDVGATVAERSWSYPTIDEVLMTHNGSPFDLKVLNAIAPEPMNFKSGPGGLAAAAVKAADILRK
ncbi:hypothetical protein ACLMJK_006063 [Lecanora helva]